jgi:hypothetical protein
LQAGPAEAFAPEAVHFASRLTVCRVHSSATLLLTAISDIPHPHPS